LFFSNAYAYDFNNVKYIRNYDGDTITFNIKNVHPLLGEEINIRIKGIDTPEIRAKCDNEKILALKAKLFVEDLCINAKRISLKNAERGKYFRIVADVYIDKINIGKLLLNNKIAVPYDGGTKINFWCIEKER
jgi:endonuclease YncB( thermonuclease family)